VSTDCGGTADVLTDPEVGWLTPTDDFDAFERAMRTVLALPAEARGTVGRCARAHAEAHFEVNRQADRMLDALLGPFAS
jgi:glycosyltransferase involved in cell wall biosynthesis